MKKRIIPSVLLNGGVTNACLSQHFQPWRTVGTLAQQLRLHVNRQCDELLLLNLNSVAQPRFELPSRLIKLIASNVDIPVGYAGGISSPLDASACINQCFDKVFMTSAFLDNPCSLKAIASVVGQQSIGVCIPYKINQEDGIRYVWDYRNQTHITSKSFEEYIELASRSAGEILLYSVDCDGQLSGMDLDVISLLARLNISKPFLLAGGAGAPQHFAEVLKSDLVQGVVAGSIFSLTKETPATIRSYCTQEGIPMRRV